MRITILHRSGHGRVNGGTRLFTDYADWLSKRGHDVLLVSPSLPRRKLYGRFFHRLPISRKPSYDDRFFKGRSFENKVLAENRPVLASDLPDADIVIGTWWETIHWLIDLPPEKGRKVHFLQGLETFSHLPFEPTRAALKAPLPKICVASWLEKVVQEEFGATDTTVVLNGIRLEEFAAERPVTERAGVGLVYSPLDIKRSEFAIAATAEVKRRGLDCRFIGFGAASPPQSAEFDSFDFKPTPDRIRDIYSAPKAWLFPSESEGFGLPILEAMAAGTPVIGTPAGAAPDLIHAGNGRLIGHNVQEMADAIEAFLTMPEDEWARHAAGAKATARANSFEKAAEQFEAALFRVLEGRRLAS